MVKVGDKIPSAKLMEDAPGNEVDLSSELASGKGIIIGVPGAFTPSCSAKHVPGFVKHKGLKDAGKVFVVSVNDPFVMSAWSDAQKGGTDIRFLADPQAEFTKALELEFEAAPVFLGPRSKRYAIVVEDGKVKKVEVEKEPSAVDVSSAEKILG